MKKAAIVLIFVCAVLVLGFLGKNRLFGAKSVRAGFRTAAVEKRDMVNSVSASGVLSALTTVQVGTEVSGQIMELLVDFNSQVTAGQIIAKINPESYETLVRQAEAELAMARAALETKKTEIARYKAELENAEANQAAAQAQAKIAEASLEDAELDFNRQKALLKKDFISQKDYDKARTAFSEAALQVELSAAQVRAAKSKVTAAKADLDIARASIREAEAQIQLKVASLDKRRVDLENTIIRSPVEGVVIDRSVDVGQTVAASLQAPTLFTIAQDLKKMQVSTSVDEADIGQIRQGQKAHFTVDAFGTRKFFGTVTQIRKMGKTVQNVVTYEVIISADNPDLSLMPGMTADVEIELVKKNGVLTVPNAALRFTPSTATSKTEAGPMVGGDSSQNGAAGRVDPEERIRELKDQLHLSPAQVDELRQKFQQMRQKIRSTMASRSEGPPLAMGELRERIRKESQAAVMGILTSEQRDVFQEMMNRETQQRGTIWALDEKGRPTPVDVALGISGPAYTEVFGKGIHSGMKVITGME